MLVKFYRKNKEITDEFVNEFLRRELMKYQGIQENLHTDNKLDIIKLTKITSHKVTDTIKLAGDILDHELCPIKAQSDDPYDMSDLIEFSLAAQSKQLSEKATFKELEFVRRESKLLFEKFLPQPPVRAQLFLKREKFKEVAISNVLHLQNKLLMNDVEKITKTGFKK